MRQIHAVRKKNVGGFSTHIKVLWYSSGSADFFALNHYSSILISPDQSPYSSLVKKDLNGTESTDPAHPGANDGVVSIHCSMNSQMIYILWRTSAFQMFPRGLREVLIFIKDKYNNPPVFITENGYGGDSREINDVARMSYYRVRTRTGLFSSFCWSAATKTIEL